MAGGRSLPVYTTGTVAVSSAGVVTGAGTNFIAPDGVANYTLLSGDLFVVPNAGLGVVGAIASASGLTLDIWIGPAVAAGSAYKIYRYEGLPSNAVTAALTQVLTLFSDANPPASQTVDTGAVRFKFDDDGAGDMRLRVRPSASPDSAYVTALTINATTGLIREATTQTGQIVVDDGAARSALTEIGGTPTLAVGPTGTAVASLTPAIAINKTTGAVSFPAGAAAPADWNRNRVINSDFQIWQYGATSFSVANNALAYAADLWLVGNNATGVTLTAAKVSPTGSSSLYGLSITGTGVASASTISVSQRFEAARIRDLGGVPVAVSFDCVASTSAGSLSGYVQFSANTAVDNGTFSAYNPAVNFTVPAGAGRVTVLMPATATANIQRGANLAIVFGQNTSAGNVSIQVAAVVLEKGLVANPWAPRSPAQELMDCARFWACSWPNNGSPASSSTLWFISPGIAIASGNQVAMSMLLSTQMRAAPTFTLYDTTGASGKISAGGSAGLSYTANGTASAIEGLTNNSGATLAASSNMNFHFSSDSRL